MRITLLGSDVDMSFAQRTNTCARSFVGTVWFEDAGSPEGCGKTSDDYYLEAFLSISGRVAIFHSLKAQSVDAIRVTLVDLHIRRGLPFQSKYNGARRIAYSFVVLIGFAMLIAGLAIYKPAQLHCLTTIFGGYEMARWEHFVGSSAITSLAGVSVLLHTPLRSRECIEKLVQASDLAFLNGVDVGIRSVVAFACSAMHVVVVAEPHYLVVLSSKF